jgi:hypothetical protein
METNKASFKSEKRVLYLNQWSERITIMDMDGLKAE